MQMRDLRDQMHDLKGRLSVLRDRARDDTMKRRSLQSLRTPSPFTAAEQWYSGAKSYTGPGLTADAGVGHSPRLEGTNETRDHMFDKSIFEDNESEKKRDPEYASSEVTSVYEDVSEGRADGSSSGRKFAEEQSFDIDAGDDQAEVVNEDDYDDEIVNREEVADYESDVSLYHDTVSVPLSHEDREDAFDYEHFFLHSAMGTISQQRHGRRDSFSSEDSVETTRGPVSNNKEANDTNPRASLGHFRSESTDSVSTMATFATATEGLGSENGEEDGQNNYAVQHVDALAVRSITPVIAKRSTFGSPAQTGHSKEPQLDKEESGRPLTAIHEPEQRNGSNIHRPSVASFDSFESTGTTRSFPLINKPKSRPSTQNGTPEPGADQNILSTNAQSNDERLQPSPVHMLAKDDQILVEQLVASLGKCVLGLQEATRGSYEGRVWRRRLDAARRMLEGEEAAI